MNPLQRKRSRPAVQCHDLKQMFKLPFLDSEYLLVMAQERWIQKRSELTWLQQLLSTFGCSFNMFPSYFHRSYPFLGNLRPSEAPAELPASQVALVPQAPLPSPARAGLGQQNLLTLTLGKKWELGFRPHTCHKDLRTLCFETTPVLTFKNRE